MTGRFVRNFAETQEDGEREDDVCGGGGAVRALMKRKENFNRS